MRVLIDSLIAVMLVAVLVCVVVLNADRKQGEADLSQVQAALEQLREQAAYHTAVQSAMAGKETLLVHMNEKWFGDDLPRNVLLDGSHPWIDLAPPGDLGDHPPDPVATDSTQAGFWYNPTTGVFRARVVPRSSEAETLALYNKVNGTALAEFEQMPDPARKPLAHVIGTTPAQQYATMANKTWVKPSADEAQAKKNEVFKLPKPKAKDTAPAGKKTRQANKPADVPADTQTPGDGPAGPEVLDQPEVIDEVVVEVPTDKPAPPRPTLKK